MQFLQTVHDIVGYQFSDLISQDIRTVNKVSDWLIPNLGTVNIIARQKEAGKSRSRRHSCLARINLEPRVSPALCQRLVAGRSSGIMGFLSLKSWDTGCSAHA